MLLSMIWKDLLISLRDKKALIIGLLMPTILTTILGFALSGVMNQNTTMSPARIAIVNQDNHYRDVERIKDFLNNSIFAKQIPRHQKEEILDSLNKFDFEKILFEEVLQDKELQKFLTYRKMTLEQAQKALENKQITAAVVIPQNFFYDTFVNFVMPMRIPVTIQVIKHPDQVLKGKIVEGILKAFTDALSAGIVAKNTFLEIAIEKNLGIKAYEEIGEITQNNYNMGIRDLKLNRISEAGKKSISGMQYYAVGMGVMFVLYAAAYGAHYTINEIKNKTYYRMILANTGLFRIFVSRFFATSIFALLQIGFLILFSMLVFRIEWGEWPGVLVLSMCLALAIGALSVLLSSINLRLKDARASIIFQAGVIQFMALIGGSFFPVELIPVLQQLQGFTINGIAMQGYLKLMRGYGIGEISDVFLILMMVSAVLLVCSGFISKGVKG